MLKNGLILTLILLSSRIQGQEVDDCRQIPLWKYDCGMLFDFPTASTTEKGNRVMVNYSKLELCTFQNDSDYIILYRDIAGKQFKLTQIKRSEVGRADGGIDECLIFELSNREVGFPIYYKFSLNAILTSRSESEQNLPQSQSLPEAVYDNEVTDFNSKVAGKSFYLKVPAKADLGDSKLKFQLVEIKKVDAGVWQLPVRVHFSGTSIGEQYIDLITCGTNVPPAFFEGHRFADYFQKNDPQILSNGEKIPDTDWQFICKGEICPGMMVEEVELALGKPTKTETIKTDTKTIITNTYSVGKVTFEEDLVTEIKLVKDL